MRALLGLARGAKRQGPPIRIQADAKPLIEQALIPIAIAEIGIQLSNADAHDAKTLGYVAGLLAGATAVIALRPTWSPLWLVAITGLVASLTCFALVLQSRAFRSGPRITRLHDILPLPSASRDDGRAAVFSALVDDFERNAALLPASTAGELQAKSWAP